MAKENAVVKMMSGRIASLAAAAKGLVGTMARRNSEKGFTSPVLGAEDRASLSAAPASTGIGKALSSAGVTNAAMVAEHQRIVIIVSTARKASLPARAAAAVCAMPVISRATTNGTTVMRRPLSHKVPMTSAASVSPPCPVSNKMPSAMPSSRAARITVAFDMLNSPCGPLIHGR